MTRSTTSSSLNAPIKRVSASRAHSSMTADAAFFARRVGRGVASWWIGHAHRHRIGSSIRKRTSTNAVERMIESRYSLCVTRSGVTSQGSDQVVHDAPIKCRSGPGNAPDPDQHRRKQRPCRELNPVPSAPLPFHLGQQVSSSGDRAVCYLVSGVRPPSANWGLQ